MNLFLSIDVVNGQEDNSAACDPSLSLPCDVVHGYEG